MKHNITVNEKRQKEKKEQTFCKINYRGLKENSIKKGEKRQKIRLKNEEQKSNSWIKKSEMEGRERVDPR